MRDESGMTLTELLGVVAVGGLIATLGMIVSIPAMARETMRAAVHDTASFLQLARMEAVSRNRPCRFSLDLLAGSLAVWDTNGTTGMHDDTLLHHGRLARSVRAERPDSGSAISLPALGALGHYGVTFTSMGMADSGGGEVYYTAGGAAGRVSVHVAGGVELAYWMGSGWRTGA